MSVCTCPSNDCPMEEADRKRRAAAKQRMEKEKTSCCCDITVQDCKGPGCDNPCLVCD